MAACIFNPAGESYICFIMQQVCKVDLVYYCDYVQQHGSNFGAVHFLFGARNFRNSLSIFIFNEVLRTKAIIFEKNI